MKKLVFMGLLLFVVTSAVNADIIRVPQHFSTIQGAINYASSGDTVLVEPGTYTENIFIGNKDISLFSTDGALETFIQPSNPDNPILDITGINHGESYIRGFTIENGGSSKTVSLNGSFGTVFIEYNRFRNNIPGIVNPLCVIYANRSSVIRRNLFYDNGGISTIWVDNNDVILVNNTIDNNGRGVLSFSTSTIAVNNIITNSTDYGVFGDFGLLDYNNVWGNGYNNTPGPNGISKDPIFNNPTTGDFTLNIESPCIDAGDPSYPLDPDGTISDIGALYNSGSLFLVSYDPGDFQIEASWGTIVEREFDLISRGLSGNIVCISESTWVNFSPDTTLLNVGDTATVQTLFDLSSVAPNDTTTTSIYFSATGPGVALDTIYVNIFSIFQLEADYDTNDFIVEVAGDTSVSRSFNLVSYGCQGYVNLTCDSSWISFPYDSVFIAANDMISIDVFFNSENLDYNTPYGTEIIVEKPEPLTDSIFIQAEITVSPPVPVTVEMLPENPPVTVIPGGYFVYEGILNNNIHSPIPYPVDLWINVEYEGSSIGPIHLLESVSVPPEGLNYPGIVQYVPVYAPVGDYKYIAYCGNYYPEIIDSAFFGFTVVPGFGEYDYDNGWNLSGWRQIGDVELPVVNRLFQNYPNPFNSSTGICFDLKEEGKVKLNVFNLQGQLVETLVDDFLAAGTHTVNWNGARQTSGIYFYRLTADSFVSTKRMTIVK